MKNIHFYNASAGSGKTHTIAREIIGNIRDNKLDPASIIATTFTNDAAAELTERIRMTLVREKCFDEAIALKNALIGTINSIGGRLLERYSLQAGLPPGLKVIEENSAAAILERLISNSIGQDFLELAIRLSQEHEGGFKKQIADIITLSRINDLDDDAIRASGEASFTKTAALFGKKDDQNLFLDKVTPLLPEMREFIKNIETDPDLFAKTTGNRRLPLYKSLENLLENLKNFSRESGPENSSWDDRFSLFDLGPDALPDNGREYRERFFSLYEKYYPLYTCKEFHEDLEQYYKRIFEIAIRVKNDYAKFKNERGLVDFTDQEHMLLKLLKENEFVRHDLSERFSMFVVDEFQDTSPIQLALFMEFNKLVNKTVWVGDPKQSIYGFRGADLRLMQSVIDEIDKKAGGNESSVLPYSYRSRKELVHFTNALFSEPFSNGHNIPPERSCLRINKNREKSPESLKSAFQVWKIAGNGDGFNKDYYANLAGKVTDVIREGWPVVQKGQEKELKTVPIRGKDIALLFHKNKECIQMAAALIDRGVRVCSRSTGLFSEPESQLLTAVLKTASGRNSLAVAEVMLFETYNGSQVELLNSRLKKIRETGADTDKMSEWERSESRWIDLIEKSGFRLKNFSLYDKACWLTGELGLRQFIAGWPNPGQRMANVEQYLFFLKQYEDSCSSAGEEADIHGFIRYAVQLTKREKDDLGIFSDNDTVTISTFHAAKGLEWPMVIITDVDYNNKPRSHFFGTRVSAAPDFNPGDPLSGRALNLWVKPVHSSRNIKAERSLDELKVLWNPPRGEATRLKDLDKQRPQLHESLPEFSEYVKSEKQEDLRKFYVAFTRARDYLVLPFFQDNRYTFWERLGKSLNVYDNGEFTEQWAEQVSAGLHRTKYIDRFERENFPFEIEVVECQPAVNAGNLVIGLNEPLQQIKSETRSAEYKKAFISPSSIEKAGSGVPAGLFHKFSVKLELKQKLPDELSAGFGDCIHHFFTAALHAEEKTYEELGRRILKNHHFESYLDPSTLAAYAAAFYDWIRTFRPVRIDSELPIRYITDEGQVFSGSIDLLITLNENLIIIDHKTFSPPENISEETLGALVTERFGNQMKAYSSMIDPTGKRVRDLLVHLPMLGMVYRIIGFQ